MPLTLAPQEPFLVAEWRKPPGFSRVFSHNTGRLAPYRYQSQWHWALASGSSNEPTALAAGKSTKGTNNPRLAPSGSQEDGVRRKDTVLFIDARHTFRQVDRAHRKFSPKQVEYLANIVRLYRGEKPEFIAGEDEELTVLNSEASELEQRIANNVAKLLED